MIGPGTGTRSVSAAVVRGWARERGIRRVSGMAGSAPEAWYSMTGDAVIERLTTDIDAGLTAAEVSARLAQYGPNALVAEPSPSLWSLAQAQLTNPMNIMLIIVAIAS